MRTLLVSAAALLFLSVSNGAQGPEGPGPAPGRTPIDPPGPGEGVTKETALAVIRQPGSYYLTGNFLGATGRNGIEIRSSDVTLDLNGYSLIGRPGTLDAITAASGLSAVRIGNGTIRGWGQDGIDGAGLSTSTVEDVLVTGCGGDGIRLGAGSVLGCRVRRCSGDGIVVEGDGAVVEGCGVEECGENPSDVGIRTAAQARVARSTVERCRGNGIEVRDGSVVSECTASANGIGIDGLDGVTVENCTALDNRFGIGIGQGVIRACTANQNQFQGITMGLSASNAGGSISSCVAQENGSQGFLIGRGVSIADCTSALNGGPGFESSQDCTFRDCVAVSNGEEGISAGLRSLVRGCTANGNTFGIRPGARSSVLDCVAQENLANGIRVDSDTLVRGNTTSANVASGIVATGNENCIDSNLVTDDDITLEASGRNTLIRNVADAYNIAPGATGFIGFIVAARSSAQSWDNIIF